MNRVDPDPFEKYPHLMQMDQPHHDEYMDKLQRLFRDIEGLPTAMQFSRMHDFVLGNMQDICMKRSEAWHFEWWDHKNAYDRANGISEKLREKSEMDKCVAKRDEAFHCKEAIREHLHFPPFDPFLSMRIAKKGLDDATDQGRE